MLKKVAAFFVVIFSKKHKSGFRAYHWLEWVTNDKNIDINAINEFFEFLLLHGASNRMDEKISKFCYLIVNAKLMFLMVVINHSRKGTLLVSAIWVSILQLSFLLDWLAKHHIGQPRMEKVAFNSWTSSLNRLSVDSADFP